MVILWRRQLEQAGTLSAAEQESMQDQARKAAAESAAKVHAAEAAQSAAEAKIGALEAEIAQLRAHPAAPGAWRSRPIGARIIFLGSLHALVCMWHLSIQDQWTVLHTCACRSHLPLVAMRQKVPHAGQHGLP